MRFTASLADQRSEELARYIRRNNLRIYGTGENDTSIPDGAEDAQMTAEECERRVLSLFSDKLKLDVRREDTEAVHHLRKRLKRETPSGIIVRFVSRRARNSVISARGQKGLRDSGVVLVEDLASYSGSKETRDEKNAF